MLLQKAKLKKTRVCLSCAVRCKQENTELFKHLSLVTTCIGKSGEVQGQ